MGHPPHSTAHRAVAHSGGAVIEWDADESFARAMYSSSLGTRSDKGRGTHAIRFSMVAGSRAAVNAVS